MAASLTQVAAQALDTNQATTVNTTSVTVAAGEMYLISIIGLMNGTNGTPTGVTAPDSTAATMIADRQAASDGNTRISMWRVKTAGSASGAFVITFSGSPTGPEGVVYEVNRVVDGVVTGTNGADLIVQSAGANGADPLSATLSSAVTSGNRAYAISGSSGSSAQTCTWDYTEQSDAAVNIGGFQCFMSTAFLAADNDATPTATWSGTGHYGLIVVELASVSTSVAFSGAAAMSLQAAGQMQLNSAVTGSAGMTLGASGSLQLNSVINAAATMSLTASGSFVELGSAIILDSPILDWTILVADDLPISPSFTGAGSFAITAAGQISLDSRLTAAAQFALTSAAALQLDSRLSGAASMALGASGQMQLNSRITGAGQLTLGGNGVLQLNSAAQLAAQMALSGSGTFATTSPLVGAAIIGLSASGALTLNSRINGASSILLAAVGQLSVTSNIIASASLSLTAAGQLSALSGIAGSAGLALTAAGQLQIESRIAAAATIQLGASGTFVGAALPIAGAGVLFLSASGTFTLATPDPQAVDWLYRHLKIEENEFLDQHVIADVWRNMTPKRYEPIPAGFPGKKQLEKAGYLMMYQVRNVTYPELIVAGLSPKLAAKVIAAIQP